MKLGIDQSLSKTALVLTKDNKIININLIKSKTDLNTEVRIRNIGVEIMKFIIANNVKEVNIENLPYSAISRSVRPLAGLYYHILILLYDNGIKCNSIEPTALKRFATGSGKASKDEMIAKLPENVLEIFNEYLNNKKLGLDDLADAYFLSLFE